MELYICGYINGYVLFIMYLKVIMQKYFRVQFICKRLTKPNIGYVHMSSSGLYHFNGSTENSV